VPHIAAIRLALAIGLAAAPALTSPQPRNAGAYLAGQHALQAGDYRAAARYLGRALLRDPSSAYLMDNTLAAHVALGHVDRAAPIAAFAPQAGIDSRIATMVTLASAADRGDWAVVLETLDAGQSAGPLMDRLAQGWALVALDRPEAARAHFAEMTADPVLAPFSLYHQALALAALGAPAEAAQVLAHPELAENDRSTLLRARLLGQEGRTADALALIDAAFPEPQARVETLRAALAGGTPPPAAPAPAPRDGLAEAFFTLAGATQGDLGSTYTLIFLRLAQHLSPGHTEAVLGCASLLREMGQPDLSSQTFAAIAPGDAAWPAATYGRAQALSEAGQRGAAIALLRDLAHSHDSAALRQSLGDMLQAAQRYREANAAYGRALVLSAEDDPGRWQLHYARGVTYERLGLWSRAEADFRAALALEPDQPLVLNYLGYSLVELGLNLDEAVGLLRRAVAARPDNGAMADSLGWALYKTGDVAAAVP